MIGSWQEEQAPEELCEYEAAAAPGDTVGLITIEVKCGSGSDSLQD